jgi:hypothetical protein
MSFLAKAIGGLASGGLLGIGGLVGKALVKQVVGKKKPEEARPAEMLDPVEREALESGDALRRRRGAASDMLTGLRGAEASGASIGRLIIGN